MRFYDASTYAHMINRHALSHGLYLTAAVFDATSRHLLIASSQPALHLYDLHTQPYPTPTATIPLSTPVSALQSTSSRVYLATPDALLCITWSDLLQARLQLAELIPRCAISSLDGVGDTVLAVSAHALFLIKHAPRVEASILTLETGIEASAQCAALSPTDPSVLYVAFSDNTLRSYDTTLDTPQTNLLQLPAKSSATRVTSLCINHSAMFALVCDTTPQLTSIYLPSLSIVSTQKPSFTPQRAVCIRSTFHIAGCDAALPQLLTLDLTLQQLATTRTMSTAIFDIAQSPDGMLVAVGCQRPRENVKPATSAQSPEKTGGMTIDFFRHPPIRSFSLHVDPPL